MIINNLILEVTRKCNCECLHCLRGSSENKSLKLQDLERMLYILDVTQVNSITFTGGEPFLETNIMAKVLDILKNRKIHLGRFYIATSASYVFTQEISNFLLELYSYCDEKVECSLELSNNAFTIEKMQNDTVSKLSAFVFTGSKVPSLNLNMRFIDSFIEEFPDVNHSGILLAGRALDNCEEIESYGYKTKKRTTGETIILTDDNEIEQIYLTCNGNIITDCDYSYDEEEDLKVCNVGDINNLDEFLSNKKVIT